MIAVHESGKGEHKMRLENKKAMIVGGGSEMAAAMAKDMLKEGAELYLVDLAEAAMEQVKADNPAAADRVHTRKGNVCSFAEMEAAAADMKEKLGRIDIMIYVAGIIRHNTIVDMPVEDWQAVIDINLTGCFNATKAVAGIMQEQNYGRILFISSIGGRTARACGCNYAASKAGMIGIMNILSLELAKYNITVNSIAPGPLRGKMFDTMEPERIKALESGIPLGRAGLMTEISPAVVFAVSDEASWMTGEVIDINGGVFVG